MIVKKLIPIKAHYFFFMAALGPILPQLQVYGKELGISSVIIGTITGILPFGFLLAKPLFGILVDVYRDYRKTIFMLIIVTMAISYFGIAFIPLRSTEEFNIKSNETIKKCEQKFMNNQTYIDVECKSKCLENFEKFQLSNGTLCMLDKEIQFQPCQFKCKAYREIPYEILLKSSSFWFYIILSSIGTIAFTVINSISDAVCFDVIGDEYDYGKQRTWGSFGYGIAALLSGYAMDTFPFLDGYKPIIPAPNNIWKELGNLLTYKRVCIFFIFSIIAGIADGFLTYFLLWYVEDIAETYSIQNVKILEGYIIAAETLGGEILFFYIGDNILKKLGHIKCFSVCFLCYALRLGLISVVTSPWSIVIIEFLLQGPTYALTYLTIVAYANEIAPSGTSATMQGIAAGLDDGLGYALGSLIGGILYKYTGPRKTFQIFSIFSMVAGILHYLIQNYLINKTETNREEAKYVTVPQKQISI